MLDEFFWRIYFRFFLKVFFIFKVIIRMFVELVYNFVNRDIYGCVLGFFFLLMYVSIRSFGSESRGLVG